MLSLFRKFRNYYRSLKWPKRPASLVIEITSVCDARCIHCPRDKMDRKMKPMDFDLFKKIIDDAEKLKIPEISPNGFGELLTIKNLEDYLAYIRSKKFRFRIGINTNANRLTKEKRDLLFKYEVDAINVCIDGATPETISKIRINLNPEQIEQNIKDLIKERNERKQSIPIVRLGFVSIPQNAHEKDLFLSKWKDISDFVGIDGYSNRMNSLDLHENRYIEDNYVCVYPFNTLNVWSDGVCVICCNDWNEEYVIGNLNSETISDVWHGLPQQQIREAHFFKKGKTIKACQMCNYWLKCNEGEKLWK